MKNLGNKKILEKCDSFIQFLSEEVSPEFAGCVSTCLFACLMWRFTQKDIQNFIEEKCKDSKETQ